MNDTQNIELLNYLKKNKVITAREASRKLNIDRASARVFDLRKKGYDIKTVMIYFTKPNGRRGRYAEYRMEG